MTRPHPVPAAPATLDAADRRLLDAVQAAVPLVRRPFAVLGEACGLPEREVLARLRALEADRVVRQIGPIFDTVRLGYRSSLVAGRVAADRVEEAAAVIGAHPGVSHSYLRDHAWNLWFTLAVPPDSALGLEGTAAVLARGAKLDAHRLLPAVRVFKIGVRLTMSDEGEAPVSPPGEPAVAATEPASLTTQERAVVAALQEPLALVPEPFEDAAARAGLGVDALLGVAEGLRRRGVMRRFAGVLHHRRAGYGANVMGVWAVPANRVAGTGATMAAFPAVSHCYERPTGPDWPYNVFTMVHGRTRQECLATLDAISERTGLRERAALWSVRELKKVRLRYFTPEWAAWEARALAGAPGHPVLLKLAGKRVVVIGAGAVGERKIEALLEAQASVRVIAPAVTSRIEAWAAAGAVVLERRSYTAGDLDGAALAYVAAADADLGRHVRQEAQARGVWVNVADRPELCDFFVPAVVRRGDLTLAVSTNGASPALARRLRERLERDLGPEYARALETLRAERARLLREEADPERRRQALERLAASLELP